MAEVKIAPPARKGREAPPTREQIVGNLERPAPDEKENLNFKVSATFKREIKTYAAAHGITLIELLAEGFELVKSKRGR